MALGRSGAAAHGTVGHDWPVTWDLAQAARHLTDRVSGAP